MIVGRFKSFWSEREANHDNEEEDDRLVYYGEVVILPPIQNGEFDKGDDDRQEQVDKERPPKRFEHFEFLENLGSISLPICERISEGFNVNVHRKNNPEHDQKLDDVKRELRRGIFISVIFAQFFFFF